MSQHTGEDERSLHHILDFIRMGSILILGLHFYYQECPPCAEWQTSNPIADQLMTALADTNLFDPPIRPKLIALFLLGVSLLGARGKKDPQYRFTTALTTLAIGTLLYFGSSALAGIPIIYCMLCFAGYLLLLRGGVYLTRIVWRRNEPDLFNRLHESFPQEERRLTNANSINLKGIYQYNARERDSWINLVDPFRGTLIIGSPGSGKTWFLIEPMIKQYIERGFAMLVYDFKCDDLSRLVYNHFEQHKDRYPAKTAYYNIHFGDVNRSHRANPLHPSTLNDLRAAGEAARAVLLGIMAHGSDQRADFFLESAVNFVQALIWFLQLYNDGLFCSWPHVIELSLIPYQELFTILSAESQLAALVAPFINAYKKAPEQLEGQIGTAGISLARLSSPAVYYIMTGDDFTLDLNDPAAPKLLTIGSNPQTTETDGPMIAAYINTINRLANQKDRHPLAEIFDEFSTIRVHTINKSIATGRSNRMAITLCTQSASLLRQTYGKDFTDSILENCGNIISGQTSGDTARALSERFGKTMQDRESLTISTADLSINQSVQLENLLPVSRITTLSSGEFVGVVADTPAQPIPVKQFCCRIQRTPSDPAPTPGTHADQALCPIPHVRSITAEALQFNFELIRSEVALLVQSELERIRNSPDFAHLVL